MIHKVEVIEVLDFIELHFGYKIVVKAKTNENKVFTYTFIKNNIEEAKKISIGYKFEMGCKPIAF